MPPSLTKWLSTKAANGAGAEVFDVQTPASNGFSNETILCRTRTPDGEERRLVVRVAPTKHFLFMDAEFSTQYRVMKALADAGSPVPLPPLGPFETDPQYLGVPFFTMEHVEGLVPPDNIPYTMEGWVIEATPEQQERLWWSGIDALAAVHRTDWRAAGLDWLDMPTRGKPGIVQQMSYYRDYLDWSAKGFSVPVVESTWEWLVANQPDEQGEVVLSWGDSRIGNIIWDDFRAAAVLDWEMASLGQPEMDLGWFLYFDRQFTDPLGRAPPGRIPVPRGDDRALLGVHGPADAGPLLLRDLLGLPLRRGHAAALGPAAREQDSPGRGGHAIEQPRHPAAGHHARPGAAGLNRLAERLRLRTSPTRSGPRVGPVVHDDVARRTDRHPGLAQAVAQPLRAVLG